MLECLLAQAGKHNMVADQRILFPLEILPELKEVRTAVWRDFIDDFSEKPTAIITRVAMEITMSRLVGCMNCEADSFRAMRGCLACARQSIKRCKEPDEAIIEVFHQTEGEIEEFIKTNNLVYGTL